MALQHKVTALYCRLSKDDDRQGESLSIEMQKTILMQFAKDNDLYPVEVYADDGYSGLNFDRPQFQRMLDDIVKDKIGTVIVKDLSRLGRDHLQVGQYTEIYFPTHRIRFIAINDGVDTKDASSGDYAALKNVINEFYSRDTSRKIKASFNARAKEGRYMTTVAPFGYLKDPADHTHLIPDPETAPYVKKIFELCASGWGNYKIRDYLRINKVPMPSWYHYIRGDLNKGVMFPTEESRYMWRPDTLRNLIRNRVYCGDCVRGKTTTIFKTKKHVKTDESEWIVVENTHEPIVSRELWEKANQLVKVKRQEYKETLTGRENIFSGIIKCADCGKALSSAKYGSHSNHRIYLCNSYRTYGKRRCSGHRTFEEDLKAAVLTDMKEKAAMLLEDREQFFKALLDVKRNTDSQKSSVSDDAYRKNIKRLRDVNCFIDKLYEDHVLGRISAENFDRMMIKYQTEQEELTEKINEYENQQAEASQTVRDIGKFFELLEKEVVDAEELTAEMINALIERIDIHEVEYEDGIATQQIDIHYWHVGKIDNTEYRSSIFYKSEKVVEASKQRAARADKKRENDVLALMSS